MGNSQNQLTLNLSEYTLTSSFQDGLFSSLDIYKKNNDQWGVMIAKDVQKMVERVAEGETEACLQRIDSLPQWYTGVKVDRWAYMGKTTTLLHTDVSPYTLIEEVGTWRSTNRPVNSDYCWFVASQLFLALVDMENRLDFHHTISMKSIYIHSDATLQILNPYIRENHLIRIIQDVVKPLLGEKVRQDDPISRDYFKRMIHIQNARNCDTLIAVIRRANANLAFTARRVGVILLGLGIGIEDFYLYQRRDTEADFDWAEIDKQLLALKNAWSKIDLNYYNLVEWLVKRPPSSLIQSSIKEITPQQLAKFSAMIDGRLGSLKCADIPRCRKTIEAIFIAKSPYNEINPIYKGNVDLIRNNIRDPSTVLPYWERLTHSTKYIPPGTNNDNSKFSDFEGKFKSNPNLKRNVSAQEQEQRSSNSPSKQVDRRNPITLKSSSPLKQHQLEPSQQVEQQTTQPWQPQNQFFSNPPNLSSSPTKPEAGSSSIRPAERLDNLLSFSLKPAQPGSSDQPAGGLKITTAESSSLPISSSKALAEFVIEPGRGESVAADRFVDEKKLSGVPRTIKPASEIYMLNSYKLQPIQEPAADGPSPNSLISTLGNLVTDMAQKDNHQKRLNSMMTRAHTGEKHSYKPSGRSDVNFQRNLSRGIGSLVEDLGFGRLSQNNGGKGSFKRDLLGGIQGMVDGLPPSTDYTMRDDEAPRMILGGLKNMIDEMDRRNQNMVGGGSSGNYYQNPLRNY